MTELTTDDLTGVNNEGPDTNRPLKYLTATSIIGDKVSNQQEEEMGVIKNIMFDITDGNIKYFIIEFGGFLGMGTKYFAIPFKLLIIDSVKKEFLFNQPREVLEKAPGFDMDHWPDTNTHYDRVYEYWSFV
jgi:sporulation protein YlmC with PRC-barrel domain